MDARERFDDLTTILRTAVNNGIANVWTALPCKVLEDSDGFVVKVQSCIQVREYNQETRRQDDVDIPPMGKVPVHFAFGGGFGITHPIKAGDEGIVIFSSRMIDSWWEEGSEQPRRQLYQRRHSLSDGMYVPGIRSKPRKLGGDNGDGRMRDGSTTKPASTTSYQIRTENGEYYIELAPEGAVNIVCRTCTITCDTLTVKASDKVRLETPLVEITGDLKVEGEIIAKAGGTGRAGDYVTMSEHVHRDTMAGPGQSGPPVPGT